MDSNHLDTGYIHTYIYLVQTHYIVYKRKILSARNPRYVCNINVVTDSPK